MLVRILQETFRRRKRRIATAIVAVLVGSSLAASLFALSTNVAEKMNQEMRAYGSNILITAQDIQTESSDGILPPGSEQYIDENELIRLKTIFWRNNIVGFAPYLSLLVKTDRGVEQVALTGTWFAKNLALPAGTQVRSTFAAQNETTTNVDFQAGVRSIAPWWHVDGNWATDGDNQEVMVGTGAAQRLGLKIGDTVTVTHVAKAQQLKVVGIIRANGPEDNQIFVNLPVAQRLEGITVGANRVLVSALTLPREKLAAEIRDKRPEEMSPRQYELWYCSPVMDAIVTQIREVLPNADVRPIRQISEAEGAFVLKVEMLILVVTVLALAASTLAVMTTFTTIVLERRGEIGLMEAIGADSRQIATLFLAEAALIGLAGGALGYLAGYQLAHFIGATVFNSSISVNPLVLPATLALAMGVALTGSAIPMRNAMRIEPVILLKGD